MEVCSGNQNSSQVYSQGSTTQGRAVLTLLNLSLWTSPHSHLVVPSVSTTRVSHQNGHWSAGVVQKITSPQLFGLIFHWTPLTCLKLTQKTPIMGPLEVSSHQRSLVCH